MLVPQSALLPIGIEHFRFFRQPPESYSMFCALTMDPHRTGISHALIFTEEGELVVGLHGTASPYLFSNQEGMDSQVCSSLLL